ncbi:MAG TPA: PAS domain-containing protein, partial [Roseococcus sp.]|nr:PAS domain-containing protein [Roseococcus sp.]
MSATPTWPFLAGGDGMGSRMREHDWSASPLGLPDTWPAPLRTIVGVMLAANQPMFVAWGPEQAMLYNDPYAEILGMKHPAALGRPFLEVWHELGDSVGPIMDRAYAGDPSASDHLTITVLRHGTPEEAHFSYFYAPLRDEHGHVGGVYCGCVEITNRVFAERRTAFRLSLEERLRDLRDPVEMMAVAASVLGAHLGVGRVGYAEVDTAEWATVERDWSPGALPTIDGRHRLADYGPALIADMRTGRTSVVADFADDPRLTPQEAAMHHGLGIGAHVVVPLVKEGRLAALLFVHAAVPRSWHADEIAAV